MTKAQETTLEHVVEDIGLMNILDYLITFTKRKGEENSIVYYSNLFKTASEALKGAVATIDAQKEPGALLTIVEGLAQQVLREGE